MDLPSFWDLENVEKSAGKLSIAFFAVASTLQSPVRYHLPHWPVSLFAWALANFFGTDRSYAVLNVLARAGLWGMFWGTFCVFSIMALAYVRVFCAGVRGLRSLSGSIMPLTALSFISMGTLALCKIPALHSPVLYDPVPSLNLFWELGFFTYGLWCLTVSWGAKPVP